ncbi:ATP-binding protein [Mycolicibacterium moriokaense]|uniref:Uncharacterized protein n=1 Tax=Mycolicibacterium moriokaense TaxID=39691 RepID=A0A318HET4_9MYCO|nr:ATP-binding protein [Mycolicibacterium moriokaense]PXX07263.1 hypothetical protein C8E89_11147 [Mycolicibacterium moriokaense]
MNLIDRIAAALADSQLRINPTVFEDCTTDLLQNTYPNLVPIRGGSDSGRDADALEPPGTPPVRMAITSSRTYEGARKNLRASIKSLKDHEILGNRIISVSLAELNQSKRKKLEELAKDHGYILESTIDRAFFADRLRQVGEWREKLLCLPGGPFSLSKYSIRGDSPHRDYELVARDEEIADIQDLPDDVLLYGVPGVGKSALLENIPGLYFTDGSPPVERLMDDILATDPTILVVDDAPRRTAVLEDVQRIRRQESLSFRIIGVSWPHQREALKTHMTEAVEMQILPLIRPDIATIARNAGITRESLIARILDQAQGRPAWAARLIDLLKSEAQWRTVHTGEAIRGEVSSYLTRSGLSREAKDLLAAIAILGTVTESEIATLAKQLEIPRLTAIHLVDDLAVGGLLDVSQQWTLDGNREHAYGVAPQILATSIVVETFFGTGPAILPVHEFFETWPKKQTAITLHCISAALLGEAVADPVARSLFNELVGSGDVGVGSDIFRYYLHLGPDEARYAIQTSIEEFHLSDGQSEFRRQALVDCIATYFADAIRDMGFIAISKDALDFAGSLDDAQLAQRFISQLIDEIRNAAIPDGSINMEPLFAIWNAAQTWFASDSGPSNSYVLTILFCELLKPSFEVNRISPEDSRLVRLLSVVLPSEYMRELAVRVWSSYAEMNIPRAHSELRLIARLFNTWMQLARGFSPAFGGTLSPDQINEAKTLAAELADYLIDHAGPYPGIRAIVRRHSGGLDRDYSEQDPLIVAVFFVPDEDADWHDRMAKHEELLNREVQNASNNLLEFVDRLAELRPHLADLDQPLTNPLHTVFRLISESDSDLLPLLLRAVENGMFPDAGPLVSVTLARQQVEENVVLELLAGEQTRSFVVQYAVNAPPSDRYARSIVERLIQDDITELYFTLGGGSLPATIAEQLLGHADVAVRAATAAAILLSTNEPLESALSPDLVVQTRAALMELAVPLRVGRRGPGEFLERLIAAAPDVYEHLVSGAIQPSPEEGSIYQRLRAFENTAPKLDVEAKTRLLTSCKPGTPEGRHTLTVLRGNDIEWMESLLVAQLVDPDEVLSAFNGFGAPAPVEALARLLVPRGVNPLTIAVKVELGSGWGEDHERLSGYVEQMRALAQSDEASIAAVGEAGLRRYEPLAEAARMSYRENQVRGRL